MAVACDICPEPAEVIRPPTRSRELARYCRYDAGRVLGWGDTFRDMTPEEKGGAAMRSRGGNGRNGDGTWPATDGRGCPVCGAITVSAPDYGAAGGHGGDCPNAGKSYDENGQEMIP